MREKARVLRTYPLAFDFDRFSFHLFRSGEKARNQAGKEGGVLRALHSNCFPAEVTQLRRFL